MWNPVSRSEVSAEWLTERLAAVAERRDRSAFAELFQHLAPYFKRFALAKGEDHQRAEELAQETMLTIWRKAATFDPEKAAPMTWLFAIARNKRIDLFRRNGLAHANIEQAPVQVEDERHGPEATYAADRARGSIQRALRALSTAQRAVIEKAFVEEKSHSVVAEELALPLGTVKSRIRLALNRLRSELAEERP
jgi:RNA polymerase sigma-70 factor (ECF subfamily)